jgi:hypothetical protein
MVVPTLVDELMEAFERDKWGRKGSGWYVGMVPEIVVAVRLYSSKDIHYIKGGRHIR